MDTRYNKYEPVFGSWHIKEKIGQGAAGEVLLIEREDLGTVYRSALKCITIPQSEDDILSIRSGGMSDCDIQAYYRSVMERINEELANQAKLKGNSNVVSYEDHMIIPHDDGMGWDILIRMELLEPLLKYCEKKPLDERSVIRLGIDMCKALELCERNGIVHRDMKPENIFVSPYGDFKLGDFGISRLVEETKSGLSRKGTYIYMAPEVYKGEPYGQESDIYSLGLVMYKFLNGGRNAFMPGPCDPVMVDDSDRAFFRRMSGAMIPAPKEGSETLKSIVLKACAYRVQDRYGSADEMREALDDLAYEMKREEEGELNQASSNDNSVSSKKNTASSRIKKKWVRAGAILAAATATATAVWLFSLPKEVTDITGINDTESIYIGESEDFAYEIEPKRFADEKISFESSDQDIFIVNKEGYVTGVSVGQAEMILRVKEYEKEVHIDVIPKVTEIDGLKSSVSLDEGKTSTLEPVLKPEQFSNEKVSYKSSDASIASVDQKGKIKANKPGKATITVSAGGSDSKVKVTVREKTQNDSMTGSTASQSYYGQNAGSSGKSSGTKPKHSSKKNKKSKKSKKSKEGYFSTGDDQYF